MNIAWPDLAAALGLLLVIEGILPFLSPRGIRRAFERLAAMDDGALRVAGAVSMVAGVAVLWLARS
ncbi:MAG TPA: DUF2065 domain-containing protein [Steroidobacteraceae bacterium]|jgi:uncharacterized protein YjeT (DUF2065 family)|nr:DUF2065 domain-containing protein [Steroidobacteraceae bacterium]